MMQMLGAFEFSLLKFDVGYPTGEKHKGFGTFALQSVGLTNLLAAEVRIFLSLTLSTMQCQSNTRWGSRITGTRPTRMWLKGWCLWHWAQFWYCNNCNYIHSPHIGRFGVSKEKAGLPETLLLKRLEGGSVEEVARWDLRLILTQFMAGHPKS